MSQRGLFVGALLGGLLGIVAASDLSVRFGLIAAVQRRPTIVGAVLGFALAALIATQTLSSPVGPILSTLLIGIGGLAGSRWPARGAANRPAGGA